MFTGPQLHIEIGSQSWPVQDGDVIGRFGNVAVEILKNSDVLSRQHLQVSWSEDGWLLTLLPNARNTTRIDGRTMTAGQTVKLGPVHDITIHELQFRLRQQEPVAREPLLGNHPVALLTLDALLQIQNYNPYAHQLLGGRIDYRTDLSSLLDSQSAVALKVALNVLQSGETSPPVEITLSLSEIRYLKLTAIRNDTSFQAALLDITAEKLRLGNQQQFDKTSQTLLHTLTPLINSPAFLEGDLAAALPRLGQLSASLLPNSAIIFWLMDRAGVLHPSTTSGNLHGINIAPVAREAFVSLMEADNHLAFLHENGALLIRDTGDENNQISIELINSLFAAVLKNTRAQQQLQKLNQREESLKIELSQAKRYLSRLMPSPLADQKLQIQYHYEPCGDLGGDVFGYQWLTQDVFCLYLVDVAGHGIGASLLAVSIVNHIRLSIERQESWLHDPSLWLQELNHTFQMEKHSGLTWTIWCGVYQASKREITFASGGHPPALLLDRGQVKELTTNGPVMGALPDIVYPSARVKVTDKAKLLLYTDGVYEFPLADGSTQSFESFLSSASSTLPMNDGECRYLHNHAAALCYGAEFPDDFTLLCIRFR